jgi:VWFA-related protein
MPRRALPFCAPVLFIALLGPLGASRQGAPQAPAPSASKPLDLVPVNVHVIDKTGRPITDLKESDFTISENGSMQQIRYFSLQAITAAAAEPGASLAPRTRITLAPQNNRIFVIMLGRGRLEDASKALTSTIAFVRKLLPQDQVALFAHNRALPFTTDHEKVVQALERCRKTHPDVDLEVDSQLGPTGMAALYGTKAISRKMQTKIDEMVQGPGAKTPALSPGDTFDQNAFRDLSIDDFMFTSAQTLGDQGNLRTLLEYLRRYEGEKHLLFVTEMGVDKATTVPSEENDRNLAQLAADGRVAIHTLQAGGMAMAESGKDTLGVTQTQALALRSLRNIADLSGGASAIMERGGASLDRLDDLTKTGYLIGYQPINTSWDGSYRNIVVKVNRPDVTVLYRRGYFRLPQAGGFDRRGEITADRLMAAGSFRREVSDIKIKAKASQNQGQLVIEGKIDLARLALTVVDGKHVGRLEMAVFCLDSSGWSVGSNTTNMPITLTDEDFARFQKDGLPYSVQFPLSRGTTNVRFIVYDYRADLIGRADTKIF